MDETDKRDEDERQEQAEPTVPPVDGPGGEDVGGTGSMSQDRPGSENRFDELVLAPHRFLC